MWGLGFKILSTLDSSWIIMTDGADYENSDKWQNYKNSTNNEFKYGTCKTLTKLSLSCIV